MTAKNYLAADYDTIRADLMAWAKANYSEKWTDFSDGHISVFLLDLAAYLGDLLAYQGNATVREANATSAVRLESVRNISRGLGHVLPEADSAQVDLLLTLDPGGTYPLTLSTTDVVSNGNDQDPVLFSPLVETTITAAEALADGYTVTVAFQEGAEYSNVLLGLADGLPGLAMLLPAESVLVSSVEVTVAGTEWTRVDHLAASDGASQHFVVRRREGAVYVIFGDGEFGAVPADTSQVRATFRVGGGLRGRLGASTIETIVSLPATVLSVTNPAAANGGRNEPSLRQARASLQASLVTLKRAVTVDDHARLARVVEGVADAVAQASAQKTNVVKLWVAPAGGGAPTGALKNAVSAYLFDKKMVGKTVQILDPHYVDLDVEVLLHVSPRAKAVDVQEAAKATLINPNGTGLLDFSQLGFGGFDENREPLITQDLLRKRLGTLAPRGLMRSEIRRLTTIPVARPRSSGNTGNGTVGSIQLDNKRRRREYYILFTSAVNFQVTCRVVGKVSNITATALQDETLDQEEEFNALNSFNLGSLCPDRRKTTTVALGVSPDTQTFLKTSGASLFTLTEVGADYYAELPIGIAGTVGVPWFFELGAMTLGFTIAAGSTPFIAGDSFTLQTYPYAGDITLDFDEYPQLLSANLTLVTSGGSKVL